MESKKDLKKLITFIKAKTNLTQQEIAERTGYGRTYLSDSIKRGSDVVYDRIAITFSDILAEFPKQNDTIKTSPKTTEAVLGDVIERLIRLEANVAVSNQMLDMLSSVQVNKAIGLVSGERQKAVSMEIDRLYAELHKKSVG